MRFSHRIGLALLIISLNGLLLNTINEDHIGLMISAIGSIIGIVLFLFEFTKSRGNE